MTQPLPHIARRSRGKYMVQQRSNMPDWKPEIGKRLAGLKLEPQREAEIVEELSQHLEDRYAESLTSGATPEKAYRVALAELIESETLQRELPRVERRVTSEPIILGANRRANMIADLLQDLRYGARMLMKQPGFTLISALTLGLGIGANTAIFSLINTILMRPLAVAQPERLARLYPSRSQGTSFPNYLDLAAGNKVFSELAGHGVTQLNLGQGDAMTRVVGELVTGNYFAALGVRPRLGRTFGAETDGAPGAHPLAVVSHGFWRRRFNADHALVGQTIALNGQKFTVIGIMPEGFRGTWPLVIAPEVWVPVTMQPSLFPGANRLEDRAGGWFEVFGRLKPEVSVAQAQATVVSQARRLAETYPEENRGLERAELLPLDTIRGASFMQAISVFAGLLTMIVGLVLLIACANVSNLLLARAAIRRQEVAIRLALGATRGRLMRQLGAESALLALVGGAAGCLLAVWLMGLARSLRTPALTPVAIAFNP